MAKRLSELGKLLVAASIFLVISGGWVAWQQYRAETARLPDADGHQGRCTLWFVGSSTIHNWESLPHDMAPWITHNRGVGGATFPQLLERFANEKELQPPEAIILYAGENDIANGATANDEITNLSHFLSISRTKYPHTPVMVVSLKPSPTRWNNFAEQGRYNGLARAIVGRDSRANFVDIVPSLLVDGRPGNFYVADGIHLNPTGYQHMAAPVRSALEEALPAATVAQCNRTAQSTDVVERR